MKSIAMRLSGRAAGSAAPVVCVLAAVLTLQAGAAMAQVKECQDEDLAPQRRIRACTVVIEDAKQADNVRAEAYANRGSVHDEEDKLDEAIADFTAALKLTPNNATLYVLRGTSYGNNSDYQRAIADFTEAIRLEPKDAGAYANRGVAYQETKQNDKAIADYRKALELEPDNETAKDGLADLTKKN